MAIKPGVNLAGVQPVMFFAADEAREIWRRRQKQLMITSGADGKHKSGSLHFVGLALDFRSQDFESLAEKSQVVNELRAALGAEFDVLLESPGQVQEHFHVEFQPKKGANF